MPDCSGLPDFPTAKAHQVKGGRRGCDARRGGAQARYRAEQYLDDAPYSEKSEGKDTGADAVPCFSVARNAHALIPRQGSVGGGGRRETSAFLCRTPPPSLPVRARFFTRLTRSRRKTERRRNGVLRRDFVCVADISTAVALLFPTAASAPLNAGNGHLHTAPILGRTTRVMCAA